MKNTYKTTIMCFAALLANSTNSFAADDDYDLIYGSQPNTKSQPRQTSIGTTPINNGTQKKQGWFLNFEDLVGVDNLDQKKGQQKSGQQKTKQQKTKQQKTRQQKSGQQKNRVMLKPSKSKTKAYVQSDARRVLVSSSRAEAARAAIGKPMIWTSGGGLSSKGRDLLRFIRGSGDQGLRPSDYQPSKFEAGLSGEELEILASKSYIRLVNDIMLGRLDTAKADYDWHIRQVQDIKSPSAILGEANRSGDIGSLLEGKLPQNSMYVGLSRALRRLKEQAGGNWAPFPSAGPRLQLGASHPHVDLLRARLGLGTTGGAMDEELKSALQAFQAKHGLNGDGVVGRRTRVALSKGASGRIIQIEQSLERLRWLPNQLPQKYVFVNTAGYELNVRENNQTVLNMRTVVGQKRRNTGNHETPSFSRNMKHIVVNPKWHVPASIISEEFLPKVQKDPNFFARGNYTIYSSTGAKVDPTKVNWHQYVKGEKIPYSAVQGNGNSNALGRIKFMLPNKYSIYLHDTPSKSLFKKERRSFSHGCVRLAEPIQLATTLLGKPEGEVKNLIDSNKNQTIYLQEPVPVFIAYITAWARDDGTVVYFDDYYGHDRRMGHNFKG